MSQSAASVVSAGEKLLLLPRRRFENDRIRIFAGEIVAVAGDLMRIRGWVFTYRTQPSGYVRKENEQTIITRLDNDTFMLVLPPASQLDKLTIDLRGNHFTVSDGAGFEWSDPQHVPG